MLLSLLFLLWNLFRLPINTTSIHPENGNTAVLSETTQLTPTLVPTVTLRPTVLPTIKPSPYPTKVPIKVTPQNNLIPEINIFRKEHGDSVLLLSDLLCSIAQKRVTELVTRGSLDDHLGIGKFTPEMLKYFSLWSEVIFFGSPPRSATTVVEDGWANSPPHKQAILLPELTHGCGAMDKGFAVFLLGKKR